MARVTEEAKKEEISKMYSMVLKGDTIKDISTELKHTEKTIRVYLDKYFPHLKDISIFKEHKTDVYSGLQQLAVSSLLTKIPQASTKDLTYLIAILEDKIRLRDGLATQKFSLDIKIEDTITRKEHVIHELREKGVAEEAIEVEFQKQVSLDGRSVNLPLTDLIENNNPDEDTGLEQLTLQIPEKKSNAKKKKQV